MNKIELTKTRNENLKLLDGAYRSNLNRFEYDAGNSIEHEMAKFICFVMLRNGVSAEIISNQFHIQNKNYLNFSGLTKWTIKEFGQKFKQSWRRPWIVTEARFKETQEDILLESSKVVKGLYRGEKPVKAINKVIKARATIKRRADLFVVDTGEIVEIETNPKVTKKGVITVRI